MFAAEEVGVAEGDVSDVCSEGLSGDGSLDCSGSGETSGFVEISVDSSSCCCRGCDDVAVVWCDDSCAEASFGVAYC